MLQESAPSTSTATSRDGLIACPLQLPSPRPAGWDDSLRALVNDDLPALASAALSLAVARQASRRIDGIIIGTGESDFTKGNYTYTLCHGAKTFQLMDVPGIEGDEGRYAQMVKEAVAKSHLVMYVNGTNKKPEVSTASKIRGYLSRGSQVCPIINVRGGPDAYEFPEDRTTLSQQGGSRDALQQTENVLGDVLGLGVLLPGLCVQGLLAFSSLALDPETGLTTIHASRSRDLGVLQRNCLQQFGSQEAMLEFSQIGRIAGVLLSKAETFREDIIESNKEKVRVLLLRSVEQLERVRAEQVRFMANQEPGFAACRSALLEALKSFERDLINGRTRLINQLFNDLCNSADAVIAENFGEEELIAPRVVDSFESGQRNLTAQTRTLLESRTNNLKVAVEQALRRLVEDVERVDFQRRAATDMPALNLVYQSMTMDMGLGLKGWSFKALGVGGYALTGATLGSVFPVVGTAIGAAAGALVGALMLAVDLFLGKERRIRKAQAQMRIGIESARSDALAQAQQSESSLLDPVRQDIDSIMQTQVDALHSILSQPTAILERQIGSMRRVLQQLERMPRGTVQAIQ